MAALDWVILSMYITELKSHKELWHVEYMPAENRVGGGFVLKYVTPEAGGAILLMYEGSQINLPNMGCHKLSWEPVDNWPRFSIPL